MTENGKRFDVEAGSKRQVNEEQKGDANEREKDGEEVKEERNTEVQESVGERLVCDSSELRSSMGEELRERQLETVEVTKVSPAVQSENYQRGGLQANSVLEMCMRAEVKEQVQVPQPEVKSVTAQHDESQTQNQLHSPVGQCDQSQTLNRLHSSVGPSSPSELSTISVTQTVTCTPSSTPQGQKQTPVNVKNVCVEDADQQNTSDPKRLLVSVVKTPIPDGYNWRKYGQKQVKSPEGSRSYYKCTFADCCAKKIECSDHGGHVIEIVNKGTHTHHPPRKNNSIRESKVASSAKPVLGNNVTGNVTKVPKQTNSEAVSEEHTQDVPIFTDRKRQNSTGSDEYLKEQTKDEDAGEPEPKRRMKKSNLECSETALKPGKKSKVVVHAVGDVGISGDGYRWRKYGQKMVKGNPHPRNYYRCTSAGCPVRKHIENAVDNTNAVIITYKGVHDHDMPVPKKRQGPPNAPLVAAAASSMNLQPKKTDTVRKQVTSTQWSVGKEGELTSETLDAGADKQKTMDSARTLLSIGFEIKPC